MWHTPTCLHLVTVRPSTKAAGYAITRVKVTCVGAGEFDPLLGKASPSGGHLSTTQASMPSSRCDRELREASAAVARSPKRQVRELDKDDLGGREDAAVPDDVPASHTPILVRHSEVQMACCTGLRDLAAWTSQGAHQGDDLELLREPSNPVGTVPVRVCLEGQKGGPELLPGVQPQCPEAPRAAASLGGGGCPGRPRSGAPAHEWPGVPADGAQAPCWPCLPG
eukprot:CAMPEP_0179082260 /NCGR_PEP_ID=MMETSP0796-20121207/37083_1 /TAXON_ID=73915 /ORGANISM="Pyrodinium bahamense, Strain pbaha01" /LENGTH=223 /DNA_ID=CAMNT_0020779655 /DNA_START=185 /DNA_END=852 /DNA_ORIENTATION=+